jgi:alpha-beta hydrolase superfamily lysophospholipase
MQQHRQFYFRLVCTGLFLASFLSASFLVMPSLTDGFFALAAPQADAAVPFLQTPPAVVWGSSIKNPRSVILCIHGLGLHKGAFDDFGKRMSAEGIPVFALDIRGFGDWHLKGNDKLDLVQSLVDVKQIVQAIRKQYPNAAVFLLGESMGGAIALRATAMYPELVNGLISSVPSGDRFSGLGEELKVGLHALLGGFGGRFNVGKHLVAHGSTTRFPDQGKAGVNEELRKRWENDPSGRSDFSPNELIAFQNFMNKNNETAQQIKATPVLVLQGQHDALVHYNATYNVWEHLGVPDAGVWPPTYAESKTAEHLIFEYGQFSKDDINFVLKWIARVLGPPPDQRVSNEPIKLPPKPAVPSRDEMVATAPNFAALENRNPSRPSDVENVSSRPGLPLLSYWIELMRDGKRYSCNNKTTFHSGDEIRVHLTCSSNGYAYILMKQGTSGAHAVLFPEARTGRNNAVTAGKDYGLPSATWLRFDEKPGTERICLIFAPVALDPDTNKYMNSHNVIVSADRSGAKDLCPTRAQLSWDDPNPLIMPSQASGASSASLVKYSQTDQPKSVIAIDIDLEHQQ